MVILLHIGKNKKCWLVVAAVVNPVSQEYARGDKCVTWIEMQGIQFRLLLIFIQINVHVSTPLYKESSKVAIFLR